VSADLIAWLTAQLDADEEAALTASPGPWRADDEEVLAADDIPVVEAFALSGPQSRATARHIAEWDPARVLAEIEAKRLAIRRELDHLALIDGMFSDGSDTAEEPCGHSADEIGSGACDMHQTATDFPVTEALARPYKGRPGWRPEWRMG
jgi:hypothetical protein